jgi:prolyl oligopeptidase PreP (S9A serine peptidase family)
VFCVACCPCLKPAELFDTEVRTDTCGCVFFSTTITGDISNKENSKVVQYRETVLEGFDPSLYIVEQRFATSKDGVTQVPMFIVRQKETNTLAEKKGKSCLLYGYGGFNISLTPSFSTFRLSFLEQGKPPLQKDCKKNPCQR